MEYMGKRVLLAAMPENGVEEEVGTVIEDYGDGMLMVDVEPKYRVDAFDDGLRECSTDQIVAFL